MMAARQPAASKGPTSHGQLSSLASSRSRAIEAEMAAAANPSNKVPKEFPHSQGLDAHSTLAPERAARPRSGRPGPGEGIPFPRSASNPGPSENGKNSATATQAHFA